MWRLGRAEKVKETEKEKEQREREKERERKKRKRKRKRKSEESRQSRELRVCVCERAGRAENCLLHSMYTSLDTSVYEQSRELLCLLFELKESEQEYGKE